MENNFYGMKGLRVAVICDRWADTYQQDLNKFMTEHDGKIVSMMQAMEQFEGHPFYEATIVYQED